MISNENNYVIVIDGADGVGKTTQINLLKEKYKDKAKFIKFPVYNSNTGFFITEYLNGNMNKILKDLNYIDKINKISSLYTMDRVLWFNTEYECKYPLICDRYTTSNIIHMGAQIVLNGGTMTNVYNYINILEQLEYEKFGIPKPDLVIYLDADTEQLSKNLKGTQQVLDIHEDERVFKNIEFIKKEIIEYCGWEVINCVNEIGMRTIKDINKDIINKIDKLI